VELLLESVRGTRAGVAKAAPGSAMKERDVGDAERFDDAPTNAVTPTVIVDELPEIPIENDP
jgi:hypothetical protein